MQGATEQGVGPGSQRREKLHRELRLRILGAKVSRQDSETDTGCAHPPPFYSPHPANSAPRPSPALGPMRVFLLAPGIICRPAPLQGESIFAQCAPPLSPSRSSGNLTLKTSKLSGAKLGAGGGQPPPPGPGGNRRISTTLFSASRAVTV